MAKASKDSLGDRMKRYEKVETARRFLPLIPVYARIDGKCFSNFTRNMKRPYDFEMTRCMVKTTKQLVEATNACVGYAQSDEISLMWYTGSTESQIFFDGKIQKMVSVLAAMTTSFFTMEAMKYWPQLVADMNPIFDARVVQLPSKEEGANMILWRELDATKNAISMAARTVCSHKSLMNKNSKQMQEMMWEQDGINFNNYPAFFKRGTFIQRRQVFKELSQEVLDKIPAGHRPSGPIERHEVVDLDMPPFNKVINRVEVVFDGANPLTE